MRDFLLRWWRNENYDPDHLRRFRDDYPGWWDIPDEAVVRSVTFAVAALGYGVGDLVEVVKREIGLNDDDCVARAAANTEDE